MERTIDGDTYAITWHPFSTRTKWGHEASLYVNGQHIRTARLYASNRLWEDYLGQTIQRAVVYQEIYARVSDACERYKARTGLRGLTAACKAEAIKQDKYIGKLRELLAQI